jgi:fructan beta-fructosidase
MTLQVFTRSSSLKYLACICLGLACIKKAESQSATEPYRPQIHFSPKEKWMNDPNGMVYYKNIYHLFFQYYPDSTVWGPMHWGHATSTDMVHWKQQPIALYPDKLGYIFSGSAVVDVHNTSGFGKNGKVPLVAIFTHHDPKGEKAGRNDYQNQSLAYSLDDGKTWTKYDHNPVLKNMGIRDFRDPKVSWYEAGKKWIMTLATQDRISFFSSPNLKDWTRESEFGKELGGHGGVWECPDLFTLDDHGKKIWVLLVSINPGGPNGGSATQYFIGHFDGHEFTSDQKDTRWIDYGPDDYAGVTWSNTGERRIFLGWMSNWWYGTSVPTKKWRSAMTVPRELSLRQINGSYYLSSMPVKELNSLEGKTTHLNDIDARNFDLGKQIGKVSGPAHLYLDGDQLDNFSIVLSNDAGEKLVIGYDKNANRYFIDRTASGQVLFAKNFAGRHTAPRVSSATGLDLHLVIDKASVELFADEGLAVMTEIFFPKHPFTKIRIQAPDAFRIRSLEYSEMRSGLKE